MANLLSDLNIFNTTGSLKSIRDSLDYQNSYIPIYKKFYGNTRINPGEIGFFIVHNNTSYLLPLNPEELTITIPGRNESREIISLGEINRLKKPGLIELTIESFFPRNEDDISQINTSNRFLSSYEYQQILEWLYKNRVHFRFVVTGYEINLMVAIESLTYRYQYGDYQDLYYTLNLKEYIPYGIELIDQTNGVNPDNNVTSTPSESTNPSDTTNAKIVVGSKVILNGTVHYDSYGSRPGNTYSNHSCYVNIINEGSPYPYHCSTTEKSGYLGWVLKDAVRLE